jgi:hypothetical protein
MAYPTVSAPYGFQPINRIDGLPYAGATKLLPILSTSNTAIFDGDIVAYGLGGVVKSGVTTDSTTSAANYTFGVFVGCQYTNSSGQTVQAQYYPGTSVTNAFAYVVVDPSAEFKVAVTNSSSVVTGTTANAIGTNVQVVQGTGSTTTGDSAQSVLAPTSGAGSAAALPCRVVGIVPDTATSTTNYVELIVKLNNPQIVTAAEAFNFA